MKIEEPTAFFRLLNEETLAKLVKHKKLSGYQHNLLREAMQSAQSDALDTQTIERAFKVLQAHDEQAKEREMRAWADELIKASMPQASKPKSVRWTPKMMGILGALLFFLLWQRYM